MASAGAGPISTSGTIISRFSTRRTAAGALQSKSLLRSTSTVRYVLHRQCDAHSVLSPFSYTNVNAAQHLPRLRLTQRDVIRGRRQDTVGTSINGAICPIFKSRHAP